ncbi:Rieske (2Fe-2S) protein [Cohnella suwonensis]|uniref:Rieske (2Fe-2S) protein n=1 Tax=Cohnella suwonensis TaxID=696072 RepID=A0ABW0LVG5_9BACL
MREERYDLGAADDYESFPAEVTIDHTPYWLVRVPGEGYRLLMAVCPHAGGDIRPMNGMLICPLHFWTFDAAEGACLNVQGERLMRRSVEERDGRLYATGGDF